MPPPASALFSELRGVTVRNTFLEFEDGCGDGLTDAGFARQVSEPAKPFNRQVSDQTTAGSGSGATLEDGSVEDGFGHLTTYLRGVSPNGPTSRDANSAGGVADNPRGMPHGFAVSGNLQATCAGAPPAVRFCPHCGAEAEPNHRFCPYCRFQLQTFQGGGGHAAPVQPQPHSPPAASDAGTSASPMGCAGGAPNLLACLRRFRYVEACPTDVGYAHALCLSLCNGVKA